MKENSLARVFLVLVGLGFLTMASAAVSEPGSFSNYVNVFFEMVKGTGGNLAMALIMMFAGYKAYQNATATPIIWGALAVVLIAASPYIADNLTTNVKTFMDL
jgi:cell division protein FtsW (lipid II flippase)